MRGGPRPRAADVAALAGVSVATVSRALGVPDAVAPETLARVQAAMRKVGYTPNAAARSLRARRAMTVLVIVPNIANPSFPEVLRGIDDALSDAGYGMIIGNLDDTEGKEGRFVDLCFAGAVDGTLLLSIGRMPRASRRSLVQAGRPIVALSEAIEGAAFPQVVIDNRRSSEAVVARMAALGHRRIAYLSGGAVYTSREREAGYRAGLAGAGIACDDALIWPGNFAFESGVAAARRFLESRSRPTALHAASDMMAIGFMHTLRTAGVRAPHDVSVVGFDGIEFAALCDPPLATVRQPRRELGRVGAELLLAAMAGEAVPQDPIVRLCASLEERGSLGPVPLCEVPLTAP